MLQTLICGPWLHGGGGRNDTEVTKVGELQLPEQAQFPFPGAPSLSERWLWFAPFGIRLCCCV